MFFVVDETLTADPVFGPLIQHVTAAKTAEGTGPVLAELEREGLLDPGARNRLEADRLQTYKGGGDAETAIAGLMGEIARLPLRDDHSFTVFLSGAHDAGAADEVPQGRALGLDMMPRRFGDRRAAVIFPREVMASCRRQIDRAAHAGAEFDYVAHRLTFTILHELGHLMNLPHPWQRDVFAASGMPAEPQARSWMNYGSLYPLGIANDFALAGFSGANRRNQTDAIARTNFLGALAKDVSFTTEERIHLFHAPHDRIAAGARTFVDAERQALRMQAPSTGSPLRLIIDGVTTSADGHEEVHLEDYGQLALHAMLQPPCGEVRLRLPVAEAGPTDGYPFRFGLDSLIWLFRQEFETRWTDSPPREQIRYDGALTALAPEVLRPAPHLRPETGGAPGAEWIEFVAPLPHLRTRVLMDGMIWCRSFSMQVIHITPDRRTLRSNVVRLLYDRVEEPAPFGAATTAIENILADETLPAVVEAALYYPTQPLDALPGVPELKARLATPLIREALTLHPARLGWLAWIVALLEAHRSLDAQVDSEEDRLGQLADLLALLPNARLRTMLERQVDTVGRVMSTVRSGGRIDQFKDRLTKTREDLRQRIPAI